MSKFDGWVCPICRTSDPNHMCGSKLEGELLERKRRYEAKRGLEKVPVENMPYDFQQWFNLRLKIGMVDLERRGFD